MIVFIPSATELFLEEPDFTILFSAYNSWYDPARVKIILYIGTHSQSSKLPELPDLNEIKWTKKPDPSVGFLDNSYESRKIVSLASYLPRFLKQQILKGRLLKYVYTTNLKKIPLLVWMPCFIRMEAIRRLEATSLKTDIVRHLYTGNRSENKNYQNHMMRNTYILCPRGYENFSFRFYEALAYGKIPVLIDTDIVLPPNVKWEKMCVRLPYKNLSELEKIIKNDYETKTESNFIERQKKAIKVVEFRKMSWQEDIIEQIAQAAQGAFSPSDD